MKWLWLSVLLLTRLALAANPQDEQVVRTAYAKLAYAVQAHTVYDTAMRQPKLTSAELKRELQFYELRYEITDMSSGALSEIASQLQSDLVTPLGTGDAVQIGTVEENHRENGKRVISNFAIAHWYRDERDKGHPDVWGIPLKDALGLSGDEGKFSRYVRATITVHFQGRSRTYRTLWLFGSEMIGADFVGAGDNAVSEFATRSVFPSVLTDTSLRSRSVVNDWLNSTQRFDASCKTGKQDVCCDSATMHCGVNSEDLRSTKPAPNTTADTEEGGIRN